MTLRPCLACGVLCGGSRCRRCQRARERQRRSAAARGYGRGWQAIRAEHLALEPDCACDCGQVATDVDHIVPRRLGGSDDHVNLQSLAHGHHSRKTVLQDGGFGNRPRGSIPGGIAGDHGVVEHRRCNPAAPRRRVLAGTGKRDLAQTMASSFARAERFCDSGSDPR